MEQPLGQEEAQAANQFTEHCGSALQGIAHLRQLGAAATKVHAMQVEARVQEEFKRMRQWLTELKNMAEEQDT